MQDFWVKFLFMFVKITWMRGGEGLPNSKFFLMSHITFDISTEPVRNYYYYIYIIIILVRNGEVFWWMVIYRGLRRLVLSYIYQKYWYTLIWQFNDFNVYFNMNKYQPEACMVPSIEKKTFRIIWASENFWKKIN